MATAGEGASCSSTEKRNRLSSEKSPYLLQHATNPVHWWEHQVRTFCTFCRIFWHIFDIQYLCYMLHLIFQHYSWNSERWIFRYPWGEEAFDAARRENKLIFLSVGYSTCHWCHVMERESFENPNIAKLMNSNFISVKVDREERPDVDKVYMTFVTVSHLNFFS